VADAIDAAVAAEAAKAKTQVQMVQMQAEVKATGRPFALTVPADMNDAELSAIVQTLVDLRRQALQPGDAKAQGSPLWTPPAPSSNGR